MIIELVNPKDAFLKNKISFYEIRKAIIRTAYNLAEQILDIPRQTLNSENEHIIALYEKHVEAEYIKCRVSTKPIIKLRAKTPTLDRILEVLEQAPYMVIPSVQILIEAELVEQPAQTTVFERNLSSILKEIIVELPFGEVELTILGYKIFLGCDYTYLCEEPDDDGAYVTVRCHDYYTEPVMRVYLEKPITVRKNVVLRIIFGPSQHIYKIEKREGTPVAKANLPKDLLYDLEVNLSISPLESARKVRQEFARAIVEAVEKGGSLFIYTFKGQTYKFKLRKVGQNIIRSDCGTITIIVKEGVGKQGDKVLICTVQLTNGEISRTFRIKNIIVKSKRSGKIIEKEKVILAV